MTQSMFTAETSERGASPSPELKLAQQFGTTETPDENLQRPLEGSAAAAPTSAANLVYSGHGLFVKEDGFIVVPKGARNAPMLLTRTPYNAAQRAERNESPQMLALLDETNLSNDHYLGWARHSYNDVLGSSAAP